MDDRPPLRSDYRAQPLASKVAGFVGLGWLAGCVFAVFAVGPVEAVVLFAALCSGAWFGNHSHQDALRGRGYAVAHVIVGGKVVPSIGQTSIDGTRVRWLRPTLPPLPPDERSDPI